MTLVNQPASPSPSENAPSHRLAPLFWMVLAGLASIAVYIRIVSLSAAFANELDKASRPIIEVIAWFGVAFVLHLIAFVAAKNLASRRIVIGLLVLFAAIFRLIMLRSMPIQEVDIYRYLWDGRVANLGVSPFKYAPQEVIAAAEETQHDDPALELLVRDQQQSPAVAEILRRVHFGQIRTVYPPVSQWGFALVDRFTGPTASVKQRLAWMRSWLVVCDMITLVIVLCLLLRVNFHPACAILYGWCPLVVKEIANSGHLDSMAVCLTTLGCYLLVRMLQSQHSLRNGVLAAVMLGLGVGAKVYPIILAPWLLVASWKKLRAGLRPPRPCSSG